MSAVALVLVAGVALGPGAPSALAASKYPTPAIAIDGLSLTVITHAPAGVLTSFGSGDVNGVGWDREPVNTAASPAGSDAAVALNGVSQNVAAFGSTGELDFYWQDNTRFNLEVIAPAGANWPVGLDWTK